MKTYILLFFISTLFNCDQASDIAKQEKLVDNLFKELTVLSESQFCSNSTEWRFVGIGNKACGGPSGYIAYSANIDTVNFLEIAEQHRNESRILNQMKGAVSDCAIEPAPRNITCSNGKAELIFD